MGTSERRERERQELRTKILDAARALFVEEGYEAVTMRRVAERIEYSPTAIYLHFADKAALLGELVASDFASLAGQFQKLAKVSDPVNRVVRTGRAYVEFGLAHPNHYRLMFMLPRPADAEQAPPPTGQPPTDAYAFLLAGVQQCIAAGRLRPELKDAELVAQILWMAVHGIVSLHIVHPKDLPPDSPAPKLRKPDKQVALMLDALVRGLAR